MICGKCGFEYTSEKCPVCAANKLAEIERQKSEPSSLGIIGMIFGITSFFLSSLFAIAGLICSIIALKQNKKDGFAIAGVTLSAIHLGLLAFALVICALTVLIPLLIYVFTIMFVLFLPILFLPLA